MKNSSRARLLSAIEELASLYPKWRMGQLLANVSDWADQEIWNIEDEQLLDAIRTRLKQRKNANASTLK